MKLTSAQMNALRYAGRGELLVTDNRTIRAVGRSRPVTEAAMALVDRGLIEYRDAGWVLVPTAAGRELLAGEKP